MERQEVGERQHPFITMGWRSPRWRASGPQKLWDPSSWSWKFGVGWSAPECGLNVIRPRTLCSEAWRDGLDSLSRRRLHRLFVEENDSIRYVSCSVCAAPCTSTCQALESCILCLEDRGQVENQDRRVDSFFFLSGFLFPRHAASQTFFNNTVIVCCWWMNFDEGFQETQALTWLLVWVHLTTDSDHELRICLIEPLMLRGNRPSVTPLQSGGNWCLRVKEMLLLQIQETFTGFLLPLNHFHVADEDSDS